MPPRGCIDPPSPFAPVEEWSAFLEGMRALPPDTPDRGEYIAQAEASIARLTRAFRPTRSSWTR